MPEATAKFMAKTAAEAVHEIFGDETALKPWPAPSLGNLNSWVIPVIHPLHT